MKGVSQLRIGDYAFRYGVAVGDLADNFANLFFNEPRHDTAEIARLTGVPEPIVYNALHRWREAGRADQ